MTDIAVRIDVWADFVCPWCYIGKRRLEQALSEFSQRDEVEVVWRSFQLDPSFSNGVRQPVPDYLAGRTGGSPSQVQEMTEHVNGLAQQEGLAFDTGRAWMVNTFDAHRVAHLADRHGQRKAMYERLMRAHHIEGHVLDDPDVLARLADEVDVPGDEVRRILAGDEYAEDVREDFRGAAAAGATGVPYFVLNGVQRISGAQPAATFLSALRSVYDAAH